MKKLSFSLLFVMICSFSFAQSYMFKVMASNGNVKLKSTNRRLWAGSTIKTNDQIIVARNAYLGLVYKNGRTVQLKRPGVYSVSSLANKLKGYKSTTSKYVSYVVGEMSKADKVDINKNHRKYMAITGSVQRAIFDNACLKISHASKSEPHALVYDNVAYLVPFSANNKNTSFEIVIKDMFENEVASYKNVKADKVLKVDLSKLKSEKGKQWIVYISASDKENAKSSYHLELIQDGDHYEAAKTALAEVGNENALDKIIRAGIYEKEGFLLDALRCYEDAIEMEPSVDTYKVAYNDFLVRNKMNNLEMNPKVNDTEVSKNK